MKKILFSIVLMVVIHSAFAQNVKKECGTRIISTAVRFTDKQKDSLNAVSAINTPYCVRVFITVFADDNGTNRADTDTDIMTNFEHMVTSLSPHNICMMLVDIRQVNNTDLNDHNPDTEQAELNPYIISGCLNIFIHRNLPGLNGTAYDIPNTYLSLDGQSYNIATMGHEAGHCLGLYHTFETGLGPENVTRNSGNACYDCDIDGDLLCDTPADDNGAVNGSCVYTGGGTDACGLTYSPMTSNMMTYGNFICRNAFTAGQGSRMRSFIATNASIQAMVAHDDVNSPPLNNISIAYSSGIRHETARDLLNISNFANDNYTVTGSTNMNMVSKKVVLKPGTSLSPSTGRVHIKVNPYCN